MPTFKKAGKWTKDFENEKWIDAYGLSDFEVSSYGRVRNKKTLQLHKASDSSNGYKKVSIKGKNYPLHRLILLSFNFIDNADLY